MMMEDMTIPMKPTWEQFQALVSEALVSEALESLPPDIAAAMENVEVVVEDEPPAEVLGGLSRGEMLLGLYHGTPLTERGLQT
jgi:predicted Zn-dependent protease with MMP-like domain